MRINSNISFLLFVYQSQKSFCPGLIAKMNDFIYFPFQALISFSFSPQSHLLLLFFSYILFLQFMLAKIYNHIPPRFFFSESAFIEKSMRESLPIHFLLTSLVMAACWVLSRCKSAPPFSSSEFSIQFNIRVSPLTLSFRLHQTSYIFYTSSSHALTFFYFYFINNQQTFKK